MCSRFSIPVSFRGDADSLNLPECLIALPPTTPFFPNRRRRANKQYKHAQAGMRVLPLSFSFYPRIPAHSGLPFGALLPSCRRFRVAHCWVNPFSLSLSFSPPLQRPLFHIKLSTALRCTRPRSRITIMQALQCRSPRVYSAGAVHQLALPNLRILRPQDACLYEYRKLQNVR